PSAGAPGRGAPDLAETRDPAGGGARAAGRNAQHYTGGGGGRGRRNGGPATACVRLGPALCSRVPRVPLNLSARRGYPSCRAESGRSFSKGSRILQRIISGGWTMARFRGLFLSVLVLLLLPAAASAQDDIKHTREATKHIGLAMTRQDE